VGGGGWAQHVTTVRYSELAGAHCPHVSFNPDIWQQAALSSLLRCNTHALQYVALPQLHCKQTVLPAVQLLSNRRSSQFYHLLTFLCSLCSFVAAAAAAQV
jgi:hypothetical protein